MTWKLGLLCNIDVALVSNTEPLVFGVFVWFAGVSPLDVWLTLFKGAFGDWFSWQNTLQRAAPLMLTAL